MLNVFLAFLVIFSLQKYTFPDTYANILFFFEYDKVDYLAVIIFLLTLQRYACKEFVFAHLREMRIGIDALV